MIDTPAIEKLLGELERLGAAATSGPWEVSCSEVGIGPDTRPIAFLEHEGRPFLVDEEPEAMDVISHDLEFIAEMRASLPTLITTIRALMEAVEEKVGNPNLNGWQPIETAPKDGTGIIVIDMSAEKPEPGYANWIFDCWSAVDGEFEGAEGDEALFHAMVWVSPTHWTPLPQPPAIRSKGEA